MKKINLRELSIKYLIMEQLYLDQPSDKEREEVAERICELLKERISKMKFQHNHKTIDEEYKCGCGWRNEVIDDICEELDYKKKWIKSILWKPK